MQRINVDLDNFLRNKGSKSKSNASHAGNVAPKSSDSLKHAWFCDQVLAQCGSTVEALRDVMPISGLALIEGLDWLKQAHRIRLSSPLIPAGLEEHKVASLEDYGYGLDAPWPITAIEYEHGGVYDVRQDFTRALSTKRIALCVMVSSRRIVHADGSEGVALAGDDGDPGALLVWPITYFDEKREWEFAPGVAIIPRAQATEELMLAENQYLALATKAQASVRKLLSRTSEDDPASGAMTLRYQPMMPELCAKLGQEHSDKMISEASLDAMWVMLGCFSAMGCDNVFIDRETRDLRVVGARGERVALDPFRGERKLSWTGRGRWHQAAQMALPVPDEARPVVDSSASVTKPSPPIEDPIDPIAHQTIDPQAPMPDRQVRRHRRRRP